MAFSILLSDAAAVQVQAASVTAPMEMQLWQLVFSALGLSFTFDPSVSNVDANIAYYEEWLSSLSAEEQAKLEGFGGTFTEFLEDGILKLPEKIWNGLKDFASSIVGELTPKYEPVSGQNIYNLTKNQLNDYVKNYFEISDSVAGTSAYSSYIDYIYKYVYDTSLSYQYHSFVLSRFAGSYFGFCLPPAACFHVESNGCVESSSLREFSFYETANGGYAYSETYFSMNYADDIFLMCINGYLYDFKDVVIFDGSSATGDYYVSDFVMPSADIISADTSMSFETTIDPSKKISDIYAVAAYDVVAPGRVWDKENKKVTGDVVIKLPDYSTLEGYNNGTIDWEKLMEEAGIQPVDTSDDTSLTKADTTISDAVTDIGASVSGIEGFVKGIYDTLTGLSDALLDGLAGLFVPAEGYFTDYFARLNDFFTEKLGFLWSPVGILIDMLESLVSSGNTDSGIVFPGLEYDGHTIAEKQTVYIEDYIEDYAGLQDAIYFIGDLILSGCVLHLFQLKIKEMMVN